MEVLCGVGWITVVAVVGCSVGGWRVEECSTAVQHVGAVAVGEQAIVANAVEAVRQGVHQKAADELAGLERHRFALAVLAIVLPAKADVAVGQRDQPAVGDGDAMGVAGEIGEHLLGAGERTLGKDDPFALTQRSEIRCEGVRILRARRGRRRIAARRLRTPPSRPSRNNRRNKRDSTRTGRKKPDLQPTQRLPSGHMPPPGTMQWTWGW